MSLIRFHHTADADSISSWTFRHIAKSIEPFSGGLLKNSEARISSIWWAYLPLAPSPTAATLAPARARKKVFRAACEEIARAFQDDRSPPAAARSLP